MLSGKGGQMSLKTNTRFVDNVALVDCSGRITLGEGTSTLRDTIITLVSGGNKEILLNLAEVNYVDASGIGELVSAFTTVTNQGGHLKLLSPTKRLVDTFQRTKLYMVFDSYEDEPAAIRSFE